jgi:outer membrane autotransporter protein
VFVKPKFSPVNNLEVFGRVGYVKSKVEFEEAGFSSTESDSGVAYGVGVNYSFNPRMSIGIDYMRFSKVSEAKIDGLTVSFGYRF